MPAVAGNYSWRSEVEAKRNEISKTAYSLRLNRLCFLLGIGRFTRRCGYCTLVFLLVFWTNASSQRPNVVISAVERSAVYDSSAVVFDSLILQHQQWLDILKTDTALFAYFRKDRGRASFNLRVSRIDTISKSAMIYKFRVIYSQKINEPVKDIEKAILGQGAAYYYIRLERFLFSGRLSIAEIRFDGIEI